MTIPNSSQRATRTFQQKMVSFHSNVSFSGGRRILFCCLCATRLHDSVSAYFYVFMGDLLSAEKTLQTNTKKYKTNSGVFVIMRYIFLIHPLQRVDSFFFVFVLFSLNLCARHMFRLTINRFHLKNNDKNK